MTNKTELEVTAADYAAAQAFFRDVRTGLAVKFQLGAEPQSLLEAFARHRLATRTPDPTPVAWMHTLHMEGGQTRERLLDWDGVDEYEPSRTGFGFPGRDYSECYPVTVTPLYAHPPAVPADGLVERMAQAISPKLQPLFAPVMADNIARELAEAAALAAYRGEV